MSANSKIEWTEEPHGTRAERADLRRTSFDHAKQRCLEHLGSYLKAYTAIPNIMRSTPGSPYSGLAPQAAAAPHHSATGNATAQGVQQAANPDVHFVNVRCTERLLGFDIRDARRLLPHERFDDGDEASMLQYRVVVDAMLCSRDEDPEHATVRYLVREGDEAWLVVEDVDETTGSTAGAEGRAESRPTR